nr:hypothetical protein [Tanacetum cinerariifolium]
MSLLEFRWRIGLYTKQQSRDMATLSRLSREEMVKASLMLLEFWPTIGDGSFNIGNTKKKSLISMGVIIELHNGGCCWPATREAEVEEEDEGDDGGDKVAGGYVGYEGVGGSADIYHNMSQGDCKFAGRVGWISKMSSREGSTLRWGNKMNEPTRCIITLSANSYTYPPVTT